MNGRPTPADLAYAREWHRRMKPVFDAQFGPDDAADSKAFGKQWAKDWRDRTRAEFAARDRRLAFEKQRAAPSATRRPDIESPAASPAGVSAPDGRPIRDLRSRPAPAGDQT